MNTAAPVTIDIPSLLPWGPIKTIQVRGEPRQLRECPTLGQDFWGVWRSAKEQLKAAGVTVAQYQGQWKATWWQAVDPVAAALRQTEAKAKADAERAELERALSGQDAQLPAEYEARMQQYATLCLGYQVPSVRRQVRALLDYRRALDSSDTGTGKTFVNLATCAVLGLKPFVVCPKAVMTSWKRAAAHFKLELAGVCNYELLRRGTTPVAKLVKTGKHEEFEWQLPSETVIIFDEQHRMKDFKTLNCKLGMAALRQGYRVLGLSATAADNPMQMKFTALLTGLIKTEKEFYGWMLRNGCTKGRFGLEFTGGRGVLHNIHRSIFPLHGTRIRIADLGDQFPETQISAEAYEMNGVASEIQRAYDDMASEIARIEASEATDKGACILTEMLRARQRSEVLKVPAMVDMAEDAEDMSVALFVNFDDTLDALAAKLGTKCVIRGGQSDDERQANIDAFQADKERVIICNIKAGGVGVSLHGSPTSRMRLAIICPTFSGQDLKQALGRVWRAKGAKSIQRIFFAAGTIEERVCEGVREKISRIDVLNDGIPDEVLVLKGERVDVVREAEERLALRAPAPGAALPTPDGRTTATYTPTPVDAKKQARREQVDAIASKITPEQVAVAHRCLQVVAGLDPDRASSRNGVGFSGSDGQWGHELAQAASLSPKQAAHAARLAWKYKGQLGDMVEPLRELVGAKGNE